MKKTFFMIAAAAVLVCSVSCKKETEKNDLSGRPVRLTATTENYGAEKTNLSGYALKWQDGDQISVMCDDFTTPGIYQVQEGGKASAGFVYAGTGEEPTLTTPLRAGYPASNWDADVANITLPSHQNYVANSMEEFPMYGETETHAVNFKNLCGVGRLRLNKSGESITKIAITTNNYLNGVYSVDYNNGEPTLQHVGTIGTNGDTLYCAEPVSIDNSTDFYIYLPAGTYGKFRIEVFNNRGLLCEINAKNAITIQRNKITTIAPSADKLKFTLVSGLITVDRTTGKQVRFSAGNLQYVDGQWRFAENQYDIYKSNSYRDQFGWSTENSQYGLGSDFTGSFVDWGNLIPTTEENNPWHVLSKDEYTYAAGGTIYPRDISKSASVRINLDENNFAEGIVIMPDVFGEDDGTTLVSSGVRRFPNGLIWRQSTNTNNTPKNTYSLEEWNYIETMYGAVFIPYANGLCGTGTSTMAQYWTTTLNDTGDQILTFNVGRRSTHGSGAYRRDDKKPVRLVQEYRPLVIEVNE